MSNIKLIFVGAGGVGKSCIIIQYVANQFVEDYDPTLEDSYRKPITVDNEPIVLDIFDTAGQEAFVAVRDSYMRTGDGFVCVYSITDEKSFQDAINLHEHILTLKDATEVPFVLVGNKCDLEDLRVVPSQKGNSLAEELSCPFLEASSKTKKNIEEIFISVVREVKKLPGKTNPDNTNPTKPNGTDSTSGSGSTKDKKRTTCSLL